MNTSVYQAPNGSVYVELPSGSFLVVRRDGGTEERHVLPGSAQLLVNRLDVAMGLA